MEAVPAVRRLAASRLVSSAGDGAAYVALMALVFARTDSTAWLAATLVATWGVFGLSSPFVGSFGDRYNRKVVLVGADLLSGIAFALMAFVTEPLALLALAACASAASAAFAASIDAAIPNVAGDEELSWANGLLGIGRNAGATVGPVIGGIAISSFAPSIVFLLNAASFVISAGLVMSVHRAFQQERTTAPEKGETAFYLEGFLALARDPTLRRLTTVMIVLVSGIGLALVADLPLAEEFGAGATGYGILLASAGVGGIAGSYSGRWMNVRTEGAWLVAATFGTALVNFAIGVSPWFMGIVALGVLGGIADGAGQVAEVGVRQRQVPDAIRARVMAASYGLIQVAYLLSYFAGAAVVQKFGPQPTYILFGGLAALAGVIAIPIAMRDERSVPDPGVSTS